MQSTRRTVVFFPRLFVTVDGYRFLYRADDECQNGNVVLICVAASNGHTDCVRLLLDAGANTEATDWVRASRSDRAALCSCTRLLVCLRILLQYTLIHAVF